MALNYDLIDLRLIVNTVDTQSLTRGAERSHMSAPAASARLKKVEESLATQLFYRSAQGLVPTAAGHAFARHARPVILELDQLDQEFQQQTKRFNGSIRLLVNTLFMGDAIPGVIEQFLVEHPGMSIDLHDRPSTEITRALKSGVADVGILTFEVPDAGLIYWAYRTEKLVLVTPREHALALGDVTDFATTLEYDYVGLSERASLHNFIMRMALAEGTAMRVRVQASTFESACSLVEAGIGVAVIPHAEAIRYSESFRIAVVPLSNAWSSRDLHVAIRDTAQLTPAAIALIEALSGKRPVGLC